MGVTGGQWPLAIHQQAFPLDGAKVLEVRSEWEARGQAGPRPSSFGPPPSALGCAALGVARGAWGMRHAACGIGVAKPGLGVHGVQGCRGAGHAGVKRSAQGCVLAGHAGLPAGRAARGSFLRADRGEAVVLEG
jgi:hypothetical protein